jgi:mRNA-degrading endonuclease RelE of RelBE toxin-antitoxin system
MSNDTVKRELIFSPEYAEFVRSVNPRTRDKLSYVVSILETVPHIPTKFVKKLVNTDFYELRVSVDNEVRVILFAADNDNINLATNVVLLNGFVKKSTKDYDREITKAISILRRVL